MLERIEVLSTTRTSAASATPTALDPEVRSLGDHLALIRDLLIALADPMGQDLVQLLARAELNAGEIADRVTLARPIVSHHLTILSSPHGLPHDPIVGLAEEHANERVNQGTELCETLMVSMSRPHLLSCWSPQAPRKAPPFIGQQHH
jgi:DNA-binding transcriptional ArsR family regulator